MTMQSRTVIDHVIYGVRELDAALERFRIDYGLEPLLYAEHPQWGTRNAVVPAGHGQFIELLAIADPDAGTPLVEGLKLLLRSRDRMVGACLRPPSLDAVAERLSLPVIDGERHEDGGVVHFRRTEPEQRPDMPFFIEWRDSGELDVRYARGRARRVAWVEFGGDAAHMRSWVNDDTVPIAVVDGRPGPRRFALETQAGDLIVIS